MTLLTHVYLVGVSHHVFLHVDFMTVLLVRHGEELATRVNLALIQNVRLSSVLIFIARDAA